MSLSAIIPVVSSCYYLNSTSKWKTGIIALETSVTVQSLVLNQNMFYANEDATKYKWISFGASHESQMW